MTISQQEFEKLPKNIQDLRWALFIESEGHTKLITKKRIQQLVKEYKVEETA